MKRNVELFLFLYYYPYVVRIIFVPPGFHEGNTCGTFTILALSSFRHNVARLLPTSLQHLPYFLTIYPLLT